MTKCQKSRVANFALSLIAHSLKIAHFKERLLAICSLNKSDIVIRYSLVVQANRLLKTSRFARKIFVWQFSPFHAQERIARVALQSYAIFKITTWAIRSRLSLQVTHDKGASGVVGSFSRANRSIAHKKTSESLEKDEQIPNP